MEYIIESLEKFNEIPAKARAAFDSSKHYDRLLEIEKIYNIPLSFVLVLLVIGELRDFDLEEYLEKKFNLEKELAEDISDQILGEVFYPAFEQFILTFQELANEHASLFSQDNLKESKFNRGEIEKAFSSNFLNILAKEDSDLVEFNNSIYYETAQDEDLDTKLINLLLNNQELISKDSIILNNKQSPASIGNWLKHFMSVYGSESFDSLSIAKYIGTDRLASRLNELEKDNLLRVLRTYYNIEFFPESMGSYAVEDWHIIPPKKESRKEKSEEAYKPGQKTRKKKESKAINPLESLAKEQLDSLNKKQISSVESLSKVESDKSKEQEAGTGLSKRSETDIKRKVLEDLLEKYNARSLEHKAIKEELLKLSKTEKDS